MKGIFRERELENQVCLLIRDWICRQSQLFCKIQTKGKSSKSQTTLQTRQETTTTNSQSGYNLHAPPSSSTVAISTDLRKTQSRNNNKSHA